MTTHGISVIVTENGIVTENILFIDKNAVKKAEQLFAKKVRQLNGSTCKEVMNEILNNCYYKYSKYNHTISGVINISWPKLCQDKKKVIGSKFPLTHRNYNKLIGLSECKK
jgi:hypothetical protein